jgi:hypothetical protein
MRRPIVRAALLAVGVALVVNPAGALARGVPDRPAVLADGASAEAGTGSDSLVTAANNATNTGRTIALSLIGLALAVAAVVLVFRRDFKEAVGVLAIGIIAVLLVSPAGLSVLQDTVSTLFGSG